LRGFCLLRHSDVNLHAALRSGEKPRRYRRNHDTNSDLIVQETFQAIQEFYRYRKLLITVNMALLEGGKLGRGRLREGPNTSLQHHTIALVSFELGVVI
jgi:hypothetical protein